MKKLLLLSLCILSFKICAENRKGCRAFGEYSYAFDINVEWDNPAYYTVGKFCSIARHLTIFLGGNHNTHWISTYPFSAQEFANKFPQAQGIQGHPSSKGNVTIGNDVWIGENVTIMSGVTIGDGAVIGTKSVVAKNIPPYAVAVGNPARVVKYRFTPEQIEKLLEIKWWNWPIERIRANSPLLSGPDIEKFLAANGK